MNWLALIQAIMQTEETIIPVVLPHPDPTQNKIVGIILATETVVTSILSKFGVIPQPPVPPAQ